jgi:hypothetical protein
VHLLVRKTSILSKFTVLQQKLNFFNRFSKNTQLQNFKKICPVGAELLHADRQTEGRTGRHDEANGPFQHNFEKAPKKYVLPKRMLKFM